MLNQEPATKAGDVPALKGYSLKIELGTPTNFKLNTLEVTSTVASIVTFIGYCIVIFYLNCFY